MKIYGSYVYTYMLKISLKSDIVATSYKRLEMEKIAASRYFQPITLRNVKICTIFRCLFASVPINSDEIFWFYTWHKSPKSVVYIFVTCPDKRIAKSNFYSFLRNFKRSQFFHKICTPSSKLILLTFHANIKPSVLF